MSRVASKNGVFGLEIVVRERPNPKGPPDVHVYIERGSETVAECYSIPPFQSITCGDDVDALRGVIGRRNVGVRVLRRTEIREPDNRNVGIGTMLYIAAVRAASRRGAILVADACHGRSTSMEARRVWSGRRFNAAVVRVGLAAAMPEELP